MLDKMTNIINDNYNTENESFMEYLHEEEIFRADLFMELIFEIIKVSKKLSIKNISEYQQYLRKLFKIYGDISSHFISHFNKNDVYKIKNSDVDLYVYLDRLTFVLDKFIYLDYQEMETYINDGRSI